MKRHRIVLYNPRAAFHTMPLGLLAVGSALDRTEFRVVIVDARLESDPEAALLSQLDGALCVGMGVLTGAPIRDALSASRAVKAARPDLPVVWGGWHPSLFPEQCLEEPSVDAVVIGQGEETFATIATHLASGQSLAGIAGAAHRESDRPRVEAPRPLRDLNELPHHDYDLIPVETYYCLKNKRQFDYISSQGCRFRCT